MRGGGGIITAARSACTEGATERRASRGGRRKGPEPGVLFCKRGELGEMLVEDLGTGEACGCLQSLRVPFPVGQGDKRGLGSLPLPAAGIHGRQRDLVAAAAAALTPYVKAAN